MFHVSFHLFRQISGRVRHELAGHRAEGGIIMLEEGVSLQREATTVPDIRQSTADGIPVDSGGARQVMQVVGIIHIVDMESTSRS